MIKSYFIIAFRNLWKTKGYSFLNIFGLAIGITCASLIFLWVENELSYDDYFANKDLLYNIKSKQTYGENTYVFSATPGKLAEAIKEEIPEVAEATRINNGVSKLFVKDDKSLYQTGAYVDPAFVNMFSLHFIEGSPKMALVDIHSLVITASMAKRLFGEEKAFGKMLKVGKGDSYNITGVVEDLPQNTSPQLRFDWLIPFKNYEQVEGGLQLWGSNSTDTYALLKPNANLEAANAKLRHFVAKKTNDEHPTASNFFYSLKRFHLYNSFKNGFEQEGAIKNIRLFSVIAWVIILIACINFMNLATARSEKRAREVGVRKVVGAEKETLIGQFIGESLLLATLSALLSIALLYLFLSPFNALVDKALDVNLFTPVHCLFLLAIVLICGLLSGSYPAFYLSSFNPIAVLKGLKFKSGNATSIRRGLVIIQFAASITLIICTVLIFQQIQHAKNRDLGFDRSQVISTEIQGDMGRHLEALKNQLKATSVVENVGGSARNALSIYSNTGSINWEGKDPNSDVLIGFNFIDADLIPTLGMRLAEGRNFNPKLAGDTTNVIINQAFAKLIKKQGSVVGTQLKTGDGSPATIVGVLHDYIYNNMYSAAEPLIFVPSVPSEGTLYIKIKSGEPLSEAIGKIEAVVKANNPSYPFEYHFMDEDFEQKFKSETMIQRLAGVFAVLSITISCLGLFGLAAFMAERRRKEMGIRKVLGASISSLANLLNKEFVLLVLVSCLIAFPLAYWFMENWLEKYQYRIHLHWSVFVLAGLGALFIALITVSSQAIKTALLNPTKTLRED
ncbi:ABC transporter permease [Olivibacter sp. XZL3]|uniref:ABC transporter permease n=1 Tax=Olivibacter sp. XZL3 TaxID=1735116 RepID=UPI0010648D10|nr:ABC transporter permease [Olivibacter sp. XZL3]